MIGAWLDYLTSEPRAAQLLDKDSSMVAALEQAMGRYLKDVKRLTFKADKRLVVKVQLQLARMEGGKLIKEKTIQTAILTVNDLAAPPSLLWLQLTGLFPRVLFAEIQSLFSIVAEISP